MPTNILDEALNEAESFVDEQLQKQQKGDEEDKNDTIEDKMEAKEETEKLLETENDEKDKTGDGSLLEVEQV